MRFAEAHNAYYFHEVGSTGAVAYIGAENWGVHFMIKGRGKNASQDFATFAMALEDTEELKGVSDRLVKLVPPLEEARIKSQYSTPGAPLVHQITGQGVGRWDMLGGSLDSQERNKLGSLSWTNTLSKDVLVTRINEVDTIIYTPDTFQQFVAIAAAKPERPKAGSIWDRV